MTRALSLALALLVFACSESTSAPPREPAAIEIAPAPPAQATEAPPTDAATEPIVDSAWPSFHGIQVLRVNADGSRDVRLLGYVDAWAEEPERNLSLATEAFEGVRLDAPPVIGARLRSLAEVGRRAFGGPTRSLLVAQYRARTMVDAVGTCGNQRATGTIVVVEGRARLRAAGSAPALELSVTRLVTSAQVATWLALAPRYRRAVAEVAHAVARGRALTREDFAPLARFRASLAAAYGPATPLLELDALLGDLETAFAEGAPERAIAALEKRCRPTDEEWRLREAFRAR